MIDALSVVCWSGIFGEYNFSFFVVEVLWNSVAGNSLKKRIILRSNPYSEHFYFLSSSAEAFLRLVFFRDILFN